VQERKKKKLEIQEEINKQKQLKIEEEKKKTVDCM
jgi:hypothetical protein